MNNCTITSILALPNVLLHYVAWSISKQQICVCLPPTMYGHILFLSPVNFFLRFVLAGAILKYYFLPFVDANT